MYCTLQIVAVGSEVPQEYAIGNRVCVENHFYCGKCYQCTHGNNSHIVLQFVYYYYSYCYSDLKHICLNLDQFGYGKGTKHGGCSEYTIIPFKYAYLLKSNIEDKKAAILER